MNLIAILMSGIVMALSSASTSLGLILPDEDSLLLEIGKFIGGALRGGGEEEATIMAEPAPVFAEDALDPNGKTKPEKQKREYKERIQAYSSSMQEWIGKTCELSDEQRAKVKDAFEKQVATDFEKFANGRIEQQQYLPETLPVLFTKPSGIAAKFEKAIITQLKSDVLTDEQEQRIDEALAERETFHKQAFLNYIVALVDRELFLTADQREALTKQLAERKGGLKHPLYSFQPQSFYLPYESLSAVIPKTTGRTFLEPSQKKRLQDLSNNDNNNGNLSFQSSAGEEEWEKQLQREGLRQRDMFLRAAAVRITFYQKELQLSAEQTAILETAAKGAAVSALGDWKDSAQQTIDQMMQHMARAGGNFGFGVNALDMRGMDSNATWKTTLDSLTENSTKQFQSSRDEAVLSSTAGSVLALYDGELWLTPEQRGPLRELIEKTLPKTAVSTQQNEYIREVALMAYALFKTSDADREKVLTEAQCNAWKQMTSFFVWHKANNYVEVPLRNQGGSFSFVLAP